MNLPLAPLRACLLLTLAHLIMGCSPPTLGVRPQAPVSVPEGVTHESETIASWDGKQLFTQNWRPAGPTRGVLMIVHGLKDHGSRYHDFAVGMARQGISVHALDLRGHGHSEGERVYVDSFGQYLDDVEAFIQRAKQNERREDFFLLGHSMGGAIATLVTLDRGVQPRGLILSAAALQVDASGGKIGATRLVDSLSPHAGVFQLDLDQFSRDARVVDAARRDPFVYQDAAPAHTAHQLLDSIHRIEANRAHVTVPLLALHGTADQVTPPSGSRLLVAESTSLDKTLQLYEGFKHDLLHEPEHDRVAADIAGWIDGRIR